MTSQIGFHLKHGSASWNRWREEQPDTAIVLDGADLNGMIPIGINCSASACPRRLAPRDEPDER
jgi:hypothetical protein